MKVREIFDVAVSISDAEQRTAYLDEVCGENLDLRRQVAELLSAAEATGHFEKTLLNLLGSALVQANDIGDTIGPYTLVERLGEGGMGTVYLAQQQEPVSRRVALKVIKFGFDTQQIIARFDAERQALALMNHDGIAKVFDAGTTDDGRPFFVMELVEGAPITQFCDERKLDTQQRLVLFVSVCQAVQHAHQKGVLHRDLKPSNVLVTEVDGQALPKIIDFGLAKAIGEPSSGRTDLTRLGQVLGTLQYMSPEQASLTSRDIDTRADIYSLGVLLYELLTGSTPLERERIGAASIDHILQWVREEEPPWPSQRLAEPLVAASAAAARDTIPAQLRRLVVGDLDHIVMKAINKDRGRRYASANELAADMHRYLSDDPVEARPPSSVYRLRKMVRKHRTPAAVFAGVTGLIIVGVIVSNVLSIRATRAESQAQADAAIAQEVTRFLQADLLGQADPVQSPDRDLTLRAVLDAAANRLGDRFASQPAVEVRLRLTLANSYLTLGEVTAAELQIDRCLRLASTSQTNRASPSVDSGPVSAAVQQIVDFYVAAGKTEDAESWRAKMHDR